MAEAPISVVIPCFNEESAILDVLAGVAHKIEGMGREFEIVVVDDGSTDGTPARLKTSRVPIRIIRHRSNRGYGASLKDGIRAAVHDYVLVMDGDGQHSPDDIPALLAEAEEYDMVVGARQGQGSHYWRMPGKYILKKLCEFLVGARIPDVNSGFRLFRKSEAARYMQLCSDEFSFSTSITLAFLSARLSVRFVPVSARARQGGRSLVTFGTGFATLMLILRIIGTFNPLPIFMPPTVLLFFTGLTYAGWGVWYQSSIPKGAVICLLASVFFFCFGLMADQLALIRREINK